MRTATLLAIASLSVLVLASQALPAEESEVGQQRASREAVAEPRRGRKNGRRKQRKRKTSKRKTSKRKTSKRTGGKRTGGKRQQTRGIAIKGKDCEYILLPDITDNSGCVDGVKFVLKGATGVRKQFLIMGGKATLGFVEKGKKFTECTAFNDITDSVQCKEIDGLASVDLSATNAAATDAPAAATTASGVATTAATTAECDTCTTSSPVCGKDGKTYDCAACATTSGQEVAYGGECKTNCPAIAVRRRGRETAGEGRSARVKRSANGAYYACDFSTSSSQCIFTATADTPAAWGGLKEHSLACSPCGAVYGGQVCSLQSSTGTELSLSPKPWTNGDEIVATGVETTGDTWTYALLFELVAPLRNLMMYNPGEATAERWAELTKAFVDCGVKNVDEAAEHGTAFSVENVYSKLTNPNGVDIHHNVLQFLEEAAIDLVCLATGLTMTRCDTIRAKWSVASGTRCNCWVPAYEAMYGVSPSVDTELATCSGILP